MNAILLAWERLFTQTQMSVEERRLRSFLALFLGLLTPALATVGTLTELYSPQSSVDVGIWLGVVGGGLSLLALRYLKNIIPVFHLGFTFTLAILGYEVAVGNGEGAAFLWFYFYPLATFFVFGKGAGLLWVAASWLIAIALLVFNWGLYHYDLAIGIRFIVSYTLVCLLGYGIESSRAYYYNQLLREKLALEAAIQQVKTLQGMLPICAACKKIRDDTGYWHQLETYISQHATVEFSHSICPDCRSYLYSRQQITEGTKPT